MEARSAMADPDEPDEVGEPDELARAHEMAQALVNQFATAGAAEFADHPHVVLEYDPTTHHKVVYGPYPSVVEALAAVTTLTDRNAEADMPEIVATAHPLFPPV